MPFHYKSHSASSTDDDLPRLTELELPSSSPSSSPSPPRKSSPAALVAVPPFSSMRKVQKTIVVTSPLALTALTSYLDAQDREPGVSFGPITARDIRTSAIVSTAGKLFLPFSFFTATY